MKEVIIKVDGMMCEGCENRIKNALKKIQEIEKIMANHKNGIVQIITKGEVNINKIKEKIQDIGFEVKE